jgi:glycosyltransferase involved in cell wall biosynthesis
MSGPRPLLSICIPTCHRPTELHQAVSSALALSIRPLELLIGDDSRHGDKRSEFLVNNIRRQIPPGVILRYSRWDPPQGQVRNVNALLVASRGRWVCLLHDDDRLVSAGVERLLEILQRHPQVQAGFGLQRVLCADGQLDPAASRRLNAAYGRVLEAAGEIASPLAAAIRQQFPNDGWIARGDLVRKLGYRVDAADAGDFDFGLRLAQASQSFFFLHEPCCDYRLSPQAVSTAKAAQFPLHAYVILEQLACTGFDLIVRRQQLKRMLAPAVAAAVHSRQRRQALRLLLQPIWWRNPVRWLRGMAYLLLLPLPPL